MTTRIGVDVGGTFTDLIAYDVESGEVVVAKRPTTTGMPEVGVTSALRDFVPAPLISGCEYFVHGTTVGLNALLERTGAVVGLLTTAGFRDVLEIRRGSRGEMLNLWWRPPPPLVPRRLRLSVSERMLATGKVLRELEREDIRVALETFASESVTAIAVAFINSYANPAHELEAEQVLRELGFDGSISLSHRVSGVYREFERTSTTVIDAYVRPATSSYVSRLENGLRELDCDAQFLMMRSGGGSMTFAEAATRPFETIGSGPVAGVEATAELARRLSLADVIAADVGGTSFDVSLIVDGRPETLNDAEILGFPVQAPWVDIRSIGAGGGSIASLDRSGLLKVGPRSAGAIPGPVAYGRGGTEPTVTDAALVLGMLGEGRLAGGLQLDLGAAEHALEPLASALGMPTADAARGIIDIASAHMVDAIQEITISRGRDSREATLVAYGGAGPLFATLLAGQLGIEQIVIPRHSGNFSAWGLLSADITQTAARMLLAPLDAEAVQRSSATWTELLDGLELRSAGDERVTRSEASLDLRYSGQEYSLTVAVDTNGAGIGASSEEIAETFAANYERTFGHTMDERVEVVAVRATVRAPLPDREAHGGGADGADGSGATWRTYSFSAGSWRDFVVLDRAVMSTVEGPALITEPTATTYLDAGYAARSSDDGSMIVTRSDA
jgi:N-methylhydantoinase A